MSERESLECPGRADWLSMQMCISIFLAFPSQYFPSECRGSGDVTHTALCRNVSHGRTATVTSSSISDLSQLRSLPIRIITDDMLFVFSLYFIELCTCVVW